MALEMTVERQEYLVDKAMTSGVKFPVVLFGQTVMATVDEWGSQINGIYIVLRAWAPEGYDVRFSVFDDDIEKVLSTIETNYWRASDD